MCVKFENDYKKALEEYGFDFKAGEVDSRNFSPANRRKVGSNAYAYQDKINNKNAAKVSVLKVLGTLGWKDGNNGLSITGIPKTLHTEAEIKAVLKKEIENLTAVIAQAKDKNSQDIDICKKFLTEFTVARIHLPLFLSSSQTSSVPL